MNVQHLFSRLWSNAGWIVRIYSHACDHIMVAMSVFVFALMFTL